MGPRFARLAVPNILSALLVPIAGLVDMAMLGHLDSMAHLAGVALASILFDYLYWSFGFLRMVTTGLTAQSVGRNQPVELDRILVRGSLVALAIGGGLVLLQSPIGDAGFWMLRGELDVESSGRAYYDARIVAAPAVLLNYVVVGWLLGRERSVDALILSALANGANIVLDYIFIFKWGWESSGAGAATAISQYAMLACGLCMVWRLGRSAPMKDVLVAFWDKKEWRRFYSLNGDMMIRTIALQTAFAVFTNGSALMGTAVLAANAVLLKVLSIASFFIDGYAYATESLAGIYAGSGQHSKLRELLRLTITVSVVTGLIIVCLFVGFPQVMFGMITVHQEVLQIIQKYMFWLFPVVGFGAIAYALDGYFIGLTLTRPMRQSMLVSLCFFLVGAALSLLVETNHGLWAAWVVFMVVRFVSLGRAARGTSGVG